MASDNIVEGAELTDRLECATCGTHTRFPHIYCSNCGGSLSDARRVTYIPGSDLRVVE